MITVTEMPFKSLVVQLSEAHAEIDRLNKWADGFSSAQLKERRLGEEYNQELRAAIETLSREKSALEAQLRTVQNAAKTIAHCQGTELEHLRKNAKFDHGLRAQIESLQERDAAMTDTLLAAEARAEAAEKLVADAPTSNVDLTGLANAIDPGLTQRNIMFHDVEPLRKAAAFIRAARAWTDKHDKGEK